MREINFRGKRVDNGEWVYGCYYTDGNRYYIITDVIDTAHALYGHRSEEVELYIVDPSTVGQYTGLKDKNGKEIYEGDIVICTYGKWHEEPKGLTRIGKVVYDIKTCAFKIAVKDSAVLVSLYDTKTKDIEVIGNIHDTPELLKEAYHVKISKPLKACDT